MDWATIKMLFSLDLWRTGFNWTLCLIYSYFLILIDQLFSSVRHSPSYPRCSFSPDHQSKIQRPVCIITGATSGVGAAAARALAGEGYHVVLVGRSPELLSQTTQVIKKKHKNACLNAFEVDLSSIISIMKFESSIKQWLLDSNMHPSIQILINNAGIMATSHRVTVDGYDQMMETNYISAFVLTNLLLPLLKNSPVPSRIVNVTSFTHRLVSDVKVDRGSLLSLSARGKYQFTHVYQCSKLCLLLFSYELHRRLYAMDMSPNISVNAADPGAVETNIMREFPKGISRLTFTLLRWLCLLQSPEGGANSVIDAALAPHEASGKYFFGGKGRTIQSSTLSFNAKLAEDLWSTSNMLFQDALLMKG